MTLFKTELKLTMEGPQITVQGCDSNLKGSIEKQKNL
jgi:hypothetical protein